MNWKIIYLTVLTGVTSVSNVVAQAEAVQAVSGEKSEGEKASSAMEHYDSKAISKIAFGACNNPRRPVKGGSMFTTVLQKKPDAFIMLGDNIYGDTEDMKLLKKKYKELEEDKAFSKLRENTRLIATWDDHDFGVNDGGNTYAKREESEQVFLDFFKEPADSVRRKRPGIYTSYVFGEMGKRCQVIVLDTRYFRDLLKRKISKKPPIWYRPTKDTSKTLLGEEQWKWLEKQLQVPADVRIIASSIQMISFEKGMENWGNVPHEQQRLFDLLKKYKAHHTVAISGDVHFAELSKKDIGGYPFYDLTSSGLSHVSPGWARMKNSFRVGESHAVLNAGMVEIDWEKKVISLAVMNRDGKKVIDHPVKFSELRFK